MVIELCVMQFWSEIILVISNQTRAARSFDFEITHMISDQITLHLVQLPLLIVCLMIESHRLCVYWTVCVDFLTVNTGREVAIRISSYQRVKKGYCVVGLSFHSEADRRLLTIEVL